MTTSSQEITSSTESPVLKQTGVIPDDGQGVDTETLLLISAAVAGYLGKRVTIKQVRAKRSAIWSQAGRQQVFNARRTSNI